MKNVSYVSGIVAGFVRRASTESPFPLTNTHGEPNTALLHNSVCTDATYKSRALRKPAPVNPGAGFFFTGGLFRRRSWSSRLDLNLASSLTLVVATRLGGVYLRGLG